MEDHNLTKPRFGVTIPEYLHMRAEGGNIYFVFNDKAWSAFSAFFAGYPLREELRPYTPSLVSCWGTENVMGPVEKTEEGCILKVDIEKQIDDRLRVAICESLSSFIFLFQIFLSEKWNEKREAKENEQTQLFSIQLFFDQTRSMHGAGVIFSISPIATSFLRKNEKKAIPNGFAEMKSHYVAKHPEDKNAMLHGLSAVIREKGTLDYKTYGNCSCLGTSPDDIRDGNGYAITSHNVDSSWQQLSLVVGLAATWEWVRKELNYV